VGDRRRNRGVVLALLALLVVTIIAGVAVTQSRMGMALLFVACLSGLLLAWRRSQLGSRLLQFAIGANIVALLLAFQFGFVELTQRFEFQGFDDIRWRVTQVTLWAAIANLPFGSGFGTFSPVYEQFAPPTLLLERGFYVNHAHNDWLELWLTGGIPAIGLLVAFLAWLVAAIVRVWKSGEPEVPTLDLALAQAASIVIVLMLLHSLIDFPLRIAAVTVLFAIACAYIISERKVERTAELSAGLERFAPKNTV
jgi:O-antigen ligase